MQAQVFICPMNTEAPELLHYIPHLPGFYYEQGELGFAGVPTTVELENILDNLFGNAILTVQYKTEGVVTATGHQDTADAVGMDRSEEAEDPLLYYGFLQNVLHLYASVYTTTCGLITITVLYDGVLTHETAA